MENVSVNYKNVYEYYIKVMRHNELENLRKDIKYWLTNERLERKNQITADDLIIKINQSLKLQKSYLDFVELTEKVSFKISIEEYVFLHNEIELFLRNLNINSINNFTSVQDVLN